MQGSSQKWFLPSGVRRTPTHICLKVSGRSESKPKERLKMRFPTCWATICMFVNMIYFCTPCFRGNKVHDTRQTTKRPWTPSSLFCHNLPPPSLNLRSRPFGVFYISPIFVHLLQMVINPPPPLQGSGIFMPCFQSWNEELRAKTGSQLLHFQVFELQAVFCCVSSASERKVITLLLINCRQRLLLMHHLTMNDLCTV